MNDVFAVTDTPIWELDLVTHDFEESALIDQIRMKSIFD
jgi:hypothetical protein